MESVIQKSARLEFARSAETGADLRHRLMMEMGTRLRTDQDIKAEKRRREDAEFVAAMEVAFASPQKIAAFTEKLDRYDTATVQALMDNERDTLAIREKIDTMLLKAHVLPDGRRVFKTEDGTRVFDEFGAQIDAEQLAPAAIDDKVPKWEQFNAAGMEMDRLTKERTDLIDYQAKLDKARERTEDPTLTEGELSALDKELGEAMPERVRKLTAERAPDQSLDAGVAPDAANDPAVQDLMRPASNPGAFQPG